MSDLFPKFDFSARRAELEGELAPVVAGLQALRAAAAAAKEAAKEAAEVAHTGSTPSSSGSIRQPAMARTRHHRSCSSCLRTSGWRCVRPMALPPRRAWCWKTPSGGPVACTLMSSRSICCRTRRQSSTAPRSRDGPNQSQWKPTSSCRIARRDWNSPVPLTGDARGSNSPARQLAARPGALLAFRARAGRHSFLSMR